MSRFPRFGRRRGAPCGRPRRFHAARGRAQGPPLRALALIVLFIVAIVTSAFADSGKRRYGIGREALPAEIAGWDIDVRPDGQGLPAGRGSVKAGEEVYMARCAACHGEFGEGAGRFPAIAGGHGTLASHDPNKTVGSYFPYLSTLFDYTRHAMPFGDAQSLSNDELYAVVAYVLHLNDVVDDKFELSKETWSQVRMPNAGGFRDDDRGSAEKAFWNPAPCMANCKGEAKIVGRARAIDVTPQDDRKPPKGVE
jgi:S-disulfanyl-L-cysteine oxidoreductase SoxD